MVSYILAIDGGGTKTIARLEHLSSKQRWQASAGEASISNNFIAAYQSIKTVVDNLLQQAGCQAEQIVAVFGLAGGGNEILANKFKHELNIPFAHLAIFNDAKTSLYGANLGKPVAMVALGTGSVGARLDESGVETNIGGWGFLAGDEGGGAKLGLAAVKVLLKELDINDKATSMLGHFIASVIGQTKYQVTQWLAAAKAKDFAAFAPKVFELAPNCPEADYILQQHIIQVEQLIDRTRAGGKLPVALLGGLAQLTVPLLSSTVKNWLVPATGTSLDGARLLAEVLVNKINQSIAHTEHG